MCVANLEQSLRTWENFAVNMFYNKINVWVDLPGIEGNEQIMSEIQNAECDWLIIRKEGKQYS